MSVDAESIENGSFGINLLEVRVGIPHSASLMSGEGDERLAVQVVISEEGEHHPGISAPPDRSTYIDGVILTDILNFTFIGRELIVFSLFGG